VNNSPKKVKTMRYIKFKKPAN